MKTSLIATTFFTVALGAPAQANGGESSDSSGSLINLAETLSDLGPLGGVVNEVNDCIPADVGVGALSPNADGGVRINLDIDPSDIRVDELLKCISAAAPGPVSSHSSPSKRSPGLDIDLGGA